MVVVVGVESEPGIVKINYDSPGKAGDRRAATKIFHVRGGTEGLTTFLCGCA